MVLPFPRCLAYALKGIQEYFYRNLTSSGVSCCEERLLQRSNGRLTKLARRAG